VTKFLLSVHVLAAIVAIGPVTVAASMFPPAARAALTRPGDGHAAGVARVLYRICGVYSALGLVVVVFGFFTAQSLGVLGQGWLIAAIALTALAALVLAFAVLPTQRNLIDEITAATAARADDADTAASSPGVSSPGASAAGVSVSAPVVAPPAVVPPGGVAATVLGEGASTAAPPTGGATVALARSRRLAMSAGIFNLLWVAVTVLMIVRPGSTTGA
jgi:hypothetical protein